MVEKLEAPKLSNHNSLKSFGAQRASGVNVMTGKIFSLPNETTKSFIFIKLLKELREGGRERARDGINCVTYSSRPPDTRCHSSIYVAMKACVHELNNKLIRACNLFCFFYKCNNASLLFFLMFFMIIIVLARARGPSQVNIFQVSLVFLRRNNYALTHPTLSFLVLITPQGNS